ncbi:hypothetical protein [Brevundimonas diminuta]|uniref:hypothetical protein n=1 Tax=Brevundimonas diminuta TaxID=293 RepID=UPI0012FA6E07|nr:hypothetical protein [Brevundimonas diminuta]
MAMTFLKLALTGKIMFDEIDDFVDRWHEQPGGKSLHDYLGLTRDEYAAWVQNPDIIPQIVTARKLNRPLEDLLEAAYEDRLAARSDSGDRLASIERWLRQRGKR